MMTLETRVSVPNEVLFRQLGDEAVVLDLRSGRYYGLDEVGFRMWSLLQQHGEMWAAFQALLDEYDVTEQELLDDFFGFVAALESRKMLEIHDG